MFSTLVISAFVLVAQGHGTPGAATPLKYDAPAGWTSKTPSSAMRLADFVLPKVDGDSEDATLTIYHFGAQAGGGVQANLDRWVGQMTQTDGKASKDVAKTSTMKVKDLALTVVDLSGTYIAEKTPGSAERYNKPDFKLIAAVVEGSGGPYYVKVVGPAKTVAKWDASIQAFLKSLRVD
ncbi:MAG: hypothetical protein ABI672_01880 [Vicinamibacteria bacterium]